MKAAVYDHPGGPEVFRYQEVPGPQLTADGVLIAVQAISVEGGDTLHRAGGEVPSAPHIVGYQPSAWRLIVGSRIAVVMTRAARGPGSEHFRDAPDPGERVPGREARWHPDDGQGGIMPLSPEMAAAGATTRWQPYFEVADCDIAAAAVTANGGTVVVPASDVPGVGRFAVALDPDGAQFAVIASVSA